MLPRVHAFYTAQIYAALRRVCAAFVVRVDTAGFAEIMLCSMGAPRVKRQIVGPFDNLDRTASGCHCRRLPARAERTGATARVTQAKR